MAAEFTPSMLTLVREAKGMSQRDLAARSGLSQAVISKAENGMADVDENRLSRLADVLDCPVSLLAHPEIRSATAMSCLHHRRRTSKLSAAAMRRIEGIAYLTRISVEGVLDGVHASVDTALRPGVDLAPSDAALALRAAWAVDGPIVDLVRLLESQGVLVIVRPLGSSSQDAVSSWPMAGDGHPPVIIVNSGLTADRQRFTIAHELGHLLLHPVPAEDQEREADEFASELLVPAAQVESSLIGLTTRDFRRLLELKERWRVSVGVLVRKAKDVGAITDRQYREFRLRMTSLGWDVNEPSDLTPERPQLFQDALTLGRRQGMTNEDLAAMARMTLAAFERYYLPQERQRTTLNSSTPFTDEAFTAPRTFKDGR